MKKKYICYDALMISKYDRQDHFIPAFRVAELYGVNPRECIFIRGEDDIWKLNGLDLDKYIHLSPDYHGDYKLPEEASE